MNRERSFLLALRAPPPPLFSSVKDSPRQGQGQGQGRPLAGMRHAPVTVLVPVPVSICNPASVPVPPPPGSRRGTCAAAPRGPSPSPSISQKLNQIVDQFLNADLSDHTGLTSRVMVSVRDSITNPSFASLKDRLLPILRALLMYQHSGLVLTALSLIFRLNRMRSETTKVLQEVVLLQSPKMVDFYRQACTHAVRLLSFFNNKSNLRGQWCVHATCPLSAPVLWLQPYARMKPSRA